MLGHIFEKSVTDIERLRAEGRGETPPKVTKKKTNEGVVYTSSAQVIRFLVEHTIGVTMAERLQALRSAHGIDVGEIAPTSEIAFWRAWLQVMPELKIVDPAYVHVSAADGETRAWPATGLSSPRSYRDLCSTLIARLQAWARAAF